MVVVVVVVVLGIQMLIWQTPIFCLRVTIPSVSAVEMNAAVVALVISKGLDGPMNGGLPGC